MTANPRLHDALEIFRELGWADASPEHAVDLPLGSAEQQRRALVGLRTGDFGEFGSYPDGSFGWVSHVGGHEFMLGLFAIRLGVSPHRACAVLSSGEHGVAVDVLAGRGEDFALRFVAAATKRRVKDPLVVLGLVERFQLPLPENRWYAEAWVNSYEKATDRFLSHLGVALAHSTQFFGGALTFGARKGLLTRDEAVTGAFGGLSTTRKATERRAWTKILVEEFAVTGEEMRAYLPQLEQVLATGDGVLVEAFAVPLIPIVSDEELIPLAVAALYAKTAKAKRKVLAKLKHRGVPAELAEPVAELEAELHPEKKHTAPKKPVPVLDIPVLDDELFALKWPTPAKPANDIPTNSGYTFRLEQDFSFTVIDPHHEEKTHTPTPYWAKQVAHNHELGGISYPTPILIAVMLGWCMNPRTAKDARWEFRNLITTSGATATDTRIAIRGLMTSPQCNPSAFAPIVKEHSPLLPVLYPLITEPLNHSMQPWVNKLLDVLIHHADVLLAATYRGHINPTEWGGLAQLASTPKATTARDKARQLREFYLGTESERR